jgi:antitoxin (DNA-binding transcriptional repressor) of toxin-antitoxin stability system
MKSIEISQVSALAPHVKPGSSLPLVLADHGRVVATIVPANNPTFGAMLERSRSRLESEGGLSGDEVRKRLGILSPTE